MRLPAHAQACKLDGLIRAAEAGRCSATRGALFCSDAGLALVNAAFDLFECDALYDLGCDVAQELGVDRDGQALDRAGELKIVGEGRNA